MSCRLKPEYLPTPCEIAAGCERIRQEWTAAERRRRTVGDGLLAAEREWRLPHIRVGACPARVRRIVAEATA